MFYTQRPFGFAVGALLFFSAGFASAQQPMQGPMPFATPVAPMALEPHPEIAPLDSKDKVENHYLDTTLALQKQIAILRKMLEREASVTEMVASYKRMGITYQPPAPDLTLCEQVPDNMACALAYPDRYAGFMPEPPLVPITIAQPVEISLDDIPQAVTELSPELAIKELLWTDITCLHGICRAVITPDITNRGARYSIKVGDVLPPGGVVESISAHGIVISSGSKKIELEPAPTRQSLRG